MFSPPFMVIIHFFLFCQLCKGKGASIRGESIHPILKEQVVHELSLMTSLVETIEDCLAKENPPVQKVLEVTVLVGELSGVEEEALAFCYPEATRDSKLLKDSVLKIEKIPLEVVCQNCGKKSSPEPIFLQCSHCGGTEVEVISGKEFRILDLEVL